MTLTAYKV